MLLNISQSLIISHWYKTAVIEISDIVQVTSHLKQLPLLQPKNLNPESVILLTCICAYI